MKDEVPIIYWLMLTLFVGLKLTEQIDWEWYWVVSPIWIYFAINAAIAFIGGFIGAFVKHFRAARKQ